MTGRRFGLIGANAAASDYQFLLIANKYNFLDNQLVDLKTYKKKANLLNVSYITSLVNHYPEYGTTQLNVDLEKVQKNYKIHNITYYAVQILMILFLFVMIAVGLIGYNLVTSIIVILFAMVLLGVMFVTYVTDGNNRNILLSLLEQVYNFDQQQSQVYTNYQYN